MSQIRAYLKQHLSPKSVDTLRSVRHASAQALAGADLWQLRLELERRIEERLRDTDAAQDVRIMAAVRDELTSELARWSEDMMDRMDVLLGASSRLIAALEDRVAELEQRVTAQSEEAVNGHMDANDARAPQLGVGS